MHGEKLKLKYCCVGPKQDIFNVVSPVSNCLYRCNKHPTCMLIVCLPTLWKYICWRLM